MSPVGWSISVIRVVFSYRVDRDSVDGDSFRVVDSVRGVVTGSFGYDEVLPRLRRELDALIAARASA